MMASRRGCLSRLWNDDQMTALKAERRCIMVELLAMAKNARRIRVDITDSDVDLALWAVRGVVESTQSVSNTAWRRHIAVVISGMRLNADELTEESLSEHLTLLAKSCLRAR